MPESEGRVFSFAGCEVIKAEYLETIEYAGSPQRITYSTEEFSAVCPFSGLPDLGRVVIEYIPADKLIELKSLKYYFVSFRNAGIYQEAVTDRIFRDIKKILSPKYLSVKTDYNIRGGILSACVIDTDIIREWQ